MSQVGWAADRSELRRRMRNAGWLGQTDQVGSAATLALNGDDGSVDWKGKRSQRE